jgi:hypothetical protein
VAGRADQLVCGGEQRSGIAAPADQMQSLGDAFAVRQFA